MGEMNIIHQVISFVDFLGSLPYTLIKYIQHEQLFLKNEQSFNKKMTINIQNGHIWNKNC